MDRLEEGNRDNKDRRVKTKVRVVTPGPVQVTLRDPCHVEVGEVGPEHCVRERTRRRRPHSVRRTHSVRRESQSVTTVLPTDTEGPLRTTYKTTKHGSRWSTG